VAGRHDRPGADGVDGGEHLGVEERPLDGELVAGRP
jgi:hypothetical protein